jgi:arylamine N-acetyltransferase
MGRFARETTTFLDHWGIRPEQGDRALLHRLGQAFAALPYENLTKLIKKHRLPPGPARRRLPAEVLADHLEQGTGGTCFALIELFAAVLGDLGYRCRPVLCDTRRRADSHCALLVHLDGGPTLLDPGYLVHEPLPLPGPGQTCQRGAVSLAADPRGGFELVSYGVRRYRLKLEAVSPRRFVALWDSSFDWTMMNGVHVCAARESGYAYLHGSKLRLQSSVGKQTLNLRGDEVQQIARRFGIAPGVVEQAYRLARRRPESEVSDG